MFLTDVGQHLLVVPARVFLLSFPKRYVVGNATISGVNLRIFLGHVERDAYGHRRDAADQ